MGVATFLDIVNYGKLKGAKDDDAVDRLNHLYTVVILLLFVFISTGAMLGNSRMDCWTPAEFPYSYETYVQSYCWVKNTYYIPMDQSIPADLVRRESQELTYYQWVPFILFLMAVLFKLPCFVWRLFNQTSGIDLNKVSVMTDSLLTMSTDETKEGVGRIALQIERWLKAHRLYQWNAFARFRQRLSKVFCLFGTKRDSSYLTQLYVFVKVLSLVNIIGQFVLLNTFMGEWYLLYGIDVLRGLFTGAGWIESPRFPKVTLCDFDIRQFENIQRYTVQCALPVNVYNDKIFFFLWFWLLWVGLVTAGSLLLWLWRVFYRQGHVNYIKKYLVIQGKFKEEDEELVKKFTQDHLRGDGIFLLRLVAQNSNIILFSDIVGELWDLYRKKVDEKSSNSSTGETSASTNQSEETKRLLTARP